jgi:hypothetical protein
MHQDRSLTRQRTACLGGRAFGETLSTLQFAMRAKLIKNKAIINLDVTGNVRQLQEEIKRLRLEIGAKRQFLQRNPRAMGGAAHPGASLAAAYAKGYDADGGSSAQDSSSGDGHRGGPGGGPALSGEAMDLMLAAMESRAIAEREKAVLLEKVGSCRARMHVCVRGRLWACLWLP